MKKILNLWAILWFVLGILVGLLITQQVYGDFEGCTPTPIPTIIVPCTPTPGVSISPVYQITPVESSPTPSESIPIPTIETQISNAASANNTNNAGQSATQTPVTPTPGITLAPCTPTTCGWK